MLLAYSKVGEMLESLSAEGNDPVEKHDGVGGEGIISGQLSGAKAESPERFSVTPMSLV